MAKSSRRRKEGARLLVNWQRDMKLSQCGSRLNSLSFGRVFKQDPWDCGRAECSVCRYKVKEVLTYRTALRKSERDAYLELE